MVCPSELGARGFSPWLQGFYVKQNILVFVLLSAVFFIIRIIVQTVNRDSTISYYPRVTTDKQKSCKVSGYTPLGPSQ